MITRTDFDMAAAELAAVPYADRASVHAYAVRLFTRLNPRFNAERFDNAVAYYLGQRETGQDHWSKAERTQTREDRFGTDEPPEPVEPEEDFEDRN